MFTSLRDMARNVFGPFDIVEKTYHEQNQGTYAQLLSRRSMEYAQDLRKKGFKIEDRQVKGVLIEKREDFLNYGEEKKSLLSFVAEENERAIYSAIILARESMRIEAGIAPSEPSFTTSATLVYRMSFFERRTPDGGDKKLFKAFDKIFANPESEFFQSGFLHGKKRREQGHKISNERIAEIMVTPSPLLGNKNPLSCLTGELSTEAAMKFIRNAIDAELGIEVPAPTNVTQLRKDI